MLRDGLAENLDMFNGNECNFKLKCDTGGCCCPLRSPPSPPMLVMDSDASYSLLLDIIHHLLPAAPPSLRETTAAKGEAREGIPSLVRSSQPLFSQYKILSIFQPSLLSSSPATQGPGHSSRTFSLRRLLATGSHHSTFTRPTRLLLEAKYHQPLPALPTISPRDKYLVVLVYLYSRLSTVRDNRL